MAEQSQRVRPSQAELRAILRDYVRWTLFDQAPGQASAPALSLPRLDTASVTDADVYAARPGRDDPRLNAEGRPRPRRFHQLGGVTTLAHGATMPDALAAQAGQADAWRRYMETELAGQPAMLLFERETVLALVKRLSPRDQQAIWDIAKRQVKEAARQHRRSLGAIKTAAREALDHLLALLYAFGRGA